ncbi:gamma-tubulin complex component 6-like isoform X2 [Limulus polyphemus]|uniref:Gamma-tubulin complex component 6-like isoform X2 n=1 Tax=Limulus polyphemus TaxID=6850 RepID=A0ABM1B6U4_LIMPO|nr:gamma-tubulin complex component 6-like isoform X2 [Limulus polyphemus]
MALSDSLDFLVRRLCETCMQNSQSNLNDSFYECQNRNVEQKVVVKQLKKKIYGTLLNLRNEGSDSWSPQELTEIDTVLMAIYKLRLDRQYDKANRLEVLVERLKDENGRIPYDIRTCLRFLVLLGSPEKCQYSPLSSFCEQSLPALINQERICILPNEPLQYGDSRVLTEWNHYYMHYPREVFEKEIVQTIASPDASIFEASPGLDLNGNALLSIGTGKSTLTKSSICAPLFGALYRRLPPEGMFHAPLDIKLQIPDLEENKQSRLLEFRLHVSTNEEKQTKVIETPSEDEGFIELETPVSSLSSSAGVEDIWQAALKSSPSSVITWETIGCYSSVMEKPFLTEAGGKAIDMLYQTLMRELCLLNPSLKPPPPILISQQKLIKDIFYLLIGIPSKTFQLSKSTVSFALQEGLYVEGLTPDSLGRMLASFLNSGANYLRLERFATESALNLRHPGGLILQAFKGGLRQYLQCYRASVLAVCEEQDKMLLLQLNHVTKGLQQQLSFLASLCNCNSDRRGEPSGGEMQFPVGVDLISHLYEETIMNWGQECFLILVFLLKCACEPYLRFLEEWIFEGNCNDPYGEFHIQVDDQFLMARDYTYWSNGHSLFYSSEENNFPVFLHSVAKDIFLCGKSLNLLKHCCPEHFLWQSRKKNLQLLLTFSEEKVSQIRKESQDYRSDMLEQAKQKQCSLTQLTKTEEEKKEVTSTRRGGQERAAFIAEIQKKIIDRKNVEAQKKRQLFNDLKNQIEEKVARRERQKEDDAAYQRKIEEEAMQIAEMEDQLKKDLTDKHSKLLEEVQIEHERLKWHAKRHFLQSARMEFLQKEDTKLLELLDGNTPSDDSPVQHLQNHDEKDVILPTWAHQALLASCKENYQKPIDDNKQTHLQKDESIDSHTSPSSSSSMIINHKNVLLEGMDVEIKPNLCPTNISLSLLSEKGLPNWAVQNDSSNSKNFDSSDNKFSRSNVERHQEFECEDSGITFHENKSRRTWHQPVTTLGSPDVYEPSKLYCEATQSWMGLRGKSKYGHVSDSQAQDVIYPDLVKPSKNLNILDIRREVSLEDIQESLDEGVQSQQESQIYSCKDELDNNNTENETAGKNVSESTVQESNDDVCDSGLGREFSRSFTDSTKEISPKEQLSAKDAIKIQVTADSTLPFSDDQKVKTQSPTVQPYKKEYPELEQKPNSHTLEKIAMHERVENLLMDGDKDINMCHYVPLCELLQRSILPPLQAQASLVNQSVINYYLGELNVKEHFSTLRNFFFFQDGEFGEALSHLLFEKVSVCRAPAELLNPVTLNSILAYALSSTIHGDSVFADNLSFAVKFVPSAFPQSAASVLNCLELRYKVDWPLNIVITEEDLDQYNRVLGLLLQMKRVLWTLTDVWFHMKKTAKYHNLHSSRQYRQLHLFRHEMQHFARVMQSYLASQVLQLTWHEFQLALKQKVHSLDDLREAHVAYLQKACFRCLLTKKATPVMKIIQNIFNLILKFHSQLLFSPWQQQPDSSELEHPSFPSLAASYKLFKEYSNFLYKVTKKLVARGYQSHLIDFLVMLDFDDHIEEGRFSDVIPT